MHKAWGHPALREVANPPCTCQGRCFTTVYSTLARPWYLVLHRYSFYMSDFPRVCIHYIYALIKYNVLHRIYSEYKYAYLYSSTILVPGTRCDIAQPGAQSTFHIQYLYQRFNHSPPFPRSYALTTQSTCMAYAYY